MTKSQKTPEEPWTMLGALNWTAAYFHSHGIDSPRASAEILLAHVLELQRIELYVRYDQPLQPAELDRYKALIRKRIDREPVAYITGEKEFWSLSLIVNPSVLIPRPETECLVEAALAVLAENDTLRVWEPGTGSGAVSVAIARERSHCRIFASDRSPAALAVARQNAVRHEVSDRIGFFAADWFEAVSARSRMFDAVVCNPPYIRRADIEGLAPEIARFEPRHALDGGPDGLDAVRHLIREAPGYLAEDGALLLEIGYDQGPAVLDIVRSRGEYAAPEILKDYGGNPRVLKVRRR
jgi:release factor glutamine methyltransferase